MKKEAVIPVAIEHEMQDSYLDYAMSVIVSRALPDVRDGLKPVHRRIMYAMDNLNLVPEGPFKKSATIVGDVIGKYHPHGDAAVYDSLVRMAQNFNLRYCLVEGHGNFGSIDGDPAAAYRYTEARMSPISIEMLKDLDKDTVDFSDNFDGSLQEPSVLPAKIPNLLVNGSTGIAVGMATNIPPHNLSEIIDSLVTLIDAPDTDNEELIKLVKGPDFPSGGLIMGLQGCRDAYRTGRGSITLRAKTELEVNGKKQTIIVSEIPYQINKTKLIEQIADGIKNGKISHISDLRDESDRNGMRIVIELASGANSQLVLNQLFKHSNMQCTFGAIMLALVDGAPKQLTLEEMLKYYLEHRKEIVSRRTVFELTKAKDRAHILEALIKAIDFIDEIIAIIRASKDRNEAEKKLIKRFKFTKIQANAILEMQLQRLTGLQKIKLEQEYAQLIKMIAFLEDLLESPRRIMDTIKQELLEIKKKYGDKRKTRIITEGPQEFDIEDLIPEEKVTVTLTDNGFIKRSAASANKPVSDIPQQSGNEVQCLTTTHHYLFMLTNLGKIYRLKVHEMPENSKQGRGTAPINMAPLTAGERVIYIFALKQLTEKYAVTLITKQGYIKKSLLRDYEGARKAGIIALKLEEGDEVTSARMTGANDSFEFIAISAAGGSTLFNTETLKTMGRVSKGSKIFKIDGKDRIKCLLNPEGGKELIVVSENGFGNRISIHQYRLPGKAGRRTDIMKINLKQDALADAVMANKNDTVVIETIHGNSSEILVMDILTAGRSRKGEKLLELSANEKVSGVYVKNAE